MCKTDCTEFSIHTITSTLLTSTVCNGKLIGRPMNNILCTDITIIDGSLQAQGLPEWTIIVFAIVGVVIVAIVIGLLIGLSVAFLNRSRYLHCTPVLHPCANCVCCVVMVALRWKTLTRIF